MILNTTDVKKHLQFRAPYTPAELNEVREQMFQHNGRLFGLEIIDQPLTSPASILVKPGAFITSDRVIVELLSDQTLAKPSIAAPYALVARTDNEVSTSNTELLFVEDQLIKSTDAVLAEFDELGLIRQNPGVALGEINKDVHGGLVDRIVITATASQADFDTRSLGFSTLKGSNLLVFRNGKKQIFNFFGGTNPAAGWKQIVGGVQYIGSGSVVSGEKWEFILDRSIQLQENFAGNGTKTAFVLTFGTYRTGLGQTLVFVDGEYKVLGADYTETNSTTVTFTTAPAAGTRVEIVVTDGVCQFETFENVIGGQTTLDLSTRLLRGGHAVLLFKNGLKLLRIDDYVDVGCERISLSAATVYGDDFSVYEIRTTLRSTLNRELRELFDVTQGISDAVLDPNSVRTASAGISNVFKTASEITSEIDAKFAGVQPVPPNDFFSGNDYVFSNITTEVDFDAESDETDVEVWALMKGKENLASITASLMVGMLAAKVKKITVPFKFSDITGSNGATIRILDSDGSELVSRAVTPSLTRDTEIFLAAALSQQPTDRFKVAVDVTMDNNDEVRLGGVSVEFDF